MSRLIADILEIKHPGFQRMVHSLEERSGKQGHDVRLISDIRRRSKQATHDLGLSIEDAVAVEVYFALQERVARDNAWLVQHVGVQASNTSQEITRAVTKWVSEQFKDAEVWALKSAVLKNLLKKMPPKLVMKSLGLRSADSMLKRNNPAEIYMLACGIETAEWQRKFKLQFKKCKPTDFDLKKLEIFMVDASRLAKLSKTSFPVSRTISPGYETGSILIVPPKSRYELDVLTITAALIESISEVRKHSAYYRVLSVRKDFGQQFFNVSQHGITHASQQLSAMGWNSIYRHLVGNDVLFEKIEQPYITKDDFVHTSAPGVLARHDARFEYWLGNDYVFFYDKNRNGVSMHLIDVLTNASNRLPYDRRYTMYGKARLADELWSRYLRHESVSEKTINEFLHSESV